jgi:hypothetical protein
MRIPPSASADVQESLRSLWATVDQLAGRDQNVLDLHGRSVANIGDGISSGDAATRRQVDAAKRNAGGSGTLGDTVKNLTVKVLLRVLGTLMVPGLEDAGILFVKSDGTIASDPDMLSLRYTNGALRLADDGQVRWHHLVWLLAGGTPNVSSVFIISGEDLNTTAPLIRVALGLDAAGHPALVPNGANLEIRAAGGGTLSELTAKKFNPDSPQTYTASNVTTDRSYDANATTLDELADVVGTLLGDLRSAGLVL